MNQEAEPNPQPARRDHESAPEHPAASARPTAIVIAIALLAMVGLGAYGIWNRYHQDRVLARTTQEQAAPTVLALPPTPGAPLDTFVLPGNVVAWSDAPLYARTSGYLQKWYYDLGAHVKKGALLAEISSPELDQQVVQAEADLITAEANAGNARAQAQRYRGLVTSDAVSRQETETLEAQAASTSSAVKSAGANVQRLKALQSFEKIYAPFDGVITARGVDTGQLISAGSGAGSGSELFHLQALQTLRVYANVPEVYSGKIHRGEKIALSFPQHPGEMFEGTLVRTADAIDPGSRTLLVEIDVPNRKGELMPGSLAQVHFKAATAGQTFIVPASALIFRHEGLRIGTVTNGNVAHLIPVTIGEDNGATVQVVAGLTAGDRVIQDPPDSLIDGQQVRVVQSGENQEGAAVEPAGSHTNGARKNSGEKK